MDMQAVKLHIDERLEAGLLPGAVCGVFLDGRPVFTYVSGYADVEKKIPLKENAVFRLASMTKPVTAAAALLCEDRGLLHIEDKVSRYLPAFSHMKVGRMENGRPMEAGEASREITLYDVLTHSSGLGSGEVGAFQYGARSLPDTLEEAVGAYAGWLLDFDPASRQCYSAAVAFDLAARIVEIASGMPYAQFLEENIFRPLGMRDTGYTVDDERFARTVKMYRLKDDGSGIQPRDFKRCGFPEFKEGYTGGSAGLFSTFRDYSLFARMLAGEGEFGGVRILSKAAVEKMRRPALSHSMEGIDDFFNWGCGVRVREKQCGDRQPLSDGSFGWSGAFSTHFWVDPKLKLTAVLMANLNDAGGADAAASAQFERDVMKELDKQKIALS